MELEQAKAKGTMDDADINDASDKAYAEYNQQMKALLGDDRYAKSQQQDAAFVAGNLRYELAKGVNPSDSRFQELFQARTAMEPVPVGTRPISLKQPDISGLSATTQGAECNA